MFSLESPQQNIPFLNSKEKIILNYPKSATMGFVLTDSRRIRNSRGKRTISVRALKVLLYGVQYAYIDKIVTFS